MKTTALIATTFAAIAGTQAMPPLINNPISHNFQCGTIDDPIIVQPDEWTSLRFWADFPERNVRVDVIQVEDVPQQIAQIESGPLRYADMRDTQVGMHLNIKPSPEYLEDTFTMSYSMSVHVGGGGPLRGRGMRLEFPCVDGVFRIERPLPVQIPETIEPEIMQEVETKDKKKSSWWKKVSRSLSKKPSSKVVLGEDLPVAVLDEMLQDEN